MQLQCVLRFPVISSLAKKMLSSSAATLIRPKWSQLPLRGIWLRPLLPSVQPAGAREFHNLCCPQSHTRTNSGCTLPKSTPNNVYQTKELLGTHVWGLLSSMPISYRCIHSTPTMYAPKKRRRSAASARKHARLEQSKKDKSKKKKQSDIKKQGHHHSTPPPRPPRRPRIPDPIEKMPQKREVPQAFLARTASSNAYISRCAVMDEQTGEVYVDPLSLFSELNHGGDANNNQQKKSIILPNVFRNSHFEYFHPSSFPNHEPPRDGTAEVAFLGRSNTGKSSLINALASLIHHTGGGSKRSSASGGGELARTSKRPGRTQTINYFGLVSNDASDYSTSPASTTSGKTDYKQSKLYLVDLPGFGYASAPDESVDDWQKKTQEFLISRASTQEEVGSKNIQLSQYGQHHASSPPLKRLYLLLDSRLPDPAHLDLTVMGWCDDYCIPYTLVLTKVDASSKAQCIKLTNQMCMRYHSLSMNQDEDDEDGEVYMDPVIYWTSSKDGLGMEELLLSVENNVFSADDEVDDDGLLGDDFEGEEDDDTEWEGSGLSKE